MPRTRRAVVYARLSVSSEESVSIERQLEAGQKYAEARGWKLVRTFEDDGVSALHNEPGERPGWRELLAAEERYDAVIIWKVDRLARNTLDFLLADKVLRERNAGIVAVEDPVDMTTAQGRAFATVLAVFAELEAETIRARVKASRVKLIEAGRVAGGMAPYGWLNVDNPAGPGVVVAQDPRTVGYVREMVERIQRGHTIYGVRQWLDEVGAPTPKMVLEHRHAMAERRERDEPTRSLDEWLSEDDAPEPGAWSYSTVEALLRHPILAGMTPFNPGGSARSGRAKRRGDNVLRDDTGLPFVDDELAILSVADWRALVAALDSRDGPRTKPRALRAKTSPLLSGLVWCGEHGGEGVRMHRCTHGSRHGYVCPDCRQLITNFEDVVVAEFLRQKGERVRWTRVEKIVEGGAALLPEIEQRLDELKVLIRHAEDRRERDKLQEQESNLLDLMFEKQAETPQVRLEFEEAGWFEDAWAAAGDDAEAQRAVLNDAVERIWVRRGGTGRRSTAQKLARLTFDWKIPEDLGPAD